MSPVPLNNPPRKATAVAVQRLPAQPAPVPSPGTRSGLPVGLVGALLGIGAVALAAGVAYTLSLALGGGPWPAALAAALGVAAAGVPLAWLAFRLADDLRPAHAAVGEAAAPSALMSRGLFMTLAEREFARARRYGTGAALLLVDVDRHAHLCEARGPAAGDAVLTAMLRQTVPTLRTADVLTQFGGAQMAVFLAHADATGALDVAERIRERTEQLDVAYPALSPEQRLRVTVSTGVAHLRPAHLSLQALIDDAQEAVAAARGAGGNCVRAAPIDAPPAGSAGAWRERRARPKPQSRPGGST